MKNDFCLANILLPIIGAYNKSLIKVMAKMSIS